MKKSEWILCPVCGNKPRNRLREDTVLKTIIQGDPWDGTTTFILNIAAELSKGESLESGMNFKWK